MKKTQVIGLIVLVASAFLLIYTYSESTTYKTFREVAAEPDKQAYVLSKLDLTTPIYYEPLKDANYMSFYASDTNAQRVKIVFYGAKPQDFERSDQVVMLGHFDTGKQIFIADKLLLKCPSKYNDTLSGQFKEQEFSAGLQSNSQDQ